MRINVGGPLKAFLSKTGDSKNGYLKIKLADDISSIGAIATITLDDGRTLTKPYVSGEGLASDSSHVILAGLGAAKATKIKIDFINAAPVERTGEFRNEDVVIGPKLS